MPSTPAGRLLPDRRQNATPGEPADFWIYSAFEKDSWLARKFGDLTHADHPGTAIRIGDDVFEILTVESTAEPGYVVRYGLKKWDAQYVVRRFIPYSPQTQRQVAADYLDETRRPALRTRLIWLFPFAGLAPDPIQARWEMQTALSMTVISVASALTGFALFMGVVQTLGNLPANRYLAFLIEYIAFESLARLLWIGFTWRPRGSLVLTALYDAWEAIARPENRRRGKLVVQSVLEGDEVIRRPGTGHLVIRSMLFDDLLAGSQPLRFEGSVYRPLNWHEEGKGLQRRWVYEFERIETDEGAKHPEYTERRTPQRQKAVEDFTRNRDRAHIFAGWWGTFPRRVQLRLETQYDFAAMKWTAITAGLFLVCGLLQVWAMTIVHASSIALAVGVYLIVESVCRLYRAKVQGQPAGSLVGMILGLFVRAPK